jgi:hypothetical protein
MFVVSEAEAAAIRIVSALDSALTELKAQLGHERDWAQQAELATQ